MSPVISIGGPPGTGTTSVAKAISEEFNLRYMSTGKLFRQIALERNLDVENLSEVAEREVDLDVDARSQEEAKKGDIIIESDLAAWKWKDLIDIKIWLTASLGARAERAYNDDKSRVAENYISLEDAKGKIKKRFDGDIKRYRKHYDIDVEDLSIYDIVIETDTLSLQEVINKVSEYIKGRLNGI